MKLKFILYLCAATVLFSACRDLETNPLPEEEITTEIGLLNIPEGFDFATTERVSLNLVTRDASDNALQGVSVKLYTADPENGGQVIVAGRSDALGQFSTDVELPNHMDSVYVVTSYPGLPNSTALAIGPTINYTLGGDRSNDDTRNKGKSIVPRSGSVKANSFTYIGTFNSWGLPDYLESPGDLITQDLLDNVNASLPEGQPVPTFNPQYLSGEIISNTNLRDSADIWVTFVHEGAGWKNALGYYTYTIGNTPTSIDDIDSLYIIFPNASFAGSGGAMLSGDKVHLGKFPPNTSVGWFLVPNGWNGSGATFKSQMKFSDENLNDFTSEENKRHLILFKDDINELLLLGIEDQSRPGGDNDFNDAVFYVTANPYSAIITDEVIEVTRACDDSDDDGVCDADDAFPDDPDKAFKSYLPGENAYTTLAFEDLWPTQGDYDFNDLVVNYQLCAITNADNEVVEVRGEFVTRASGAGFENGFGFELPIASSAVSAVTGSELTESYISLESNGTESGQTNAVVIVYDNIYNQITRAGNFYFNTQDAAPKIDPDTVNITISLAQSITMSDVQAFNPFIISNKRRGYEIHLKGKTPTDLVNSQLFGTSDDRTNASQNKYYETETGLPWGIVLPVSFDYPKETREITKAYRRFGDWAESGGFSFDDWYQNITDYRNADNIYNK